MKCSGVGGRFQWAIVDCRRKRIRALDTPPARSMTIHRGI